MARKGRNDFGFTLIELLVVIAIIAILAAILFPVFANARERGRQTQCLSNIKQLTLSFRQYMDDNKGRMPCINWTVGNPINGQMTVDWAGTKVFKPALLDQGSLWPYVKAEKMYNCPTDKNRKALKVTGQPRDYGLSYAVNEKLNMTNVDGLAKDPAKLCLMVHESRDTINDGYFDWDYSAGLEDRLADVHYEGTTIGYMDGHAKRKDSKQLYAESKTKDINGNYIWDIK